VPSCCENLVTFPTVMTMSVVALFRQPLVDGPGSRGLNSPTFQTMGEVGTGVVLFGLRFSDGSIHRNLDDRGSKGRLGTRGGSGGGFTGSQEFWAPLPPGDFEIWVAWPAAGIPETGTVLDGTRVRNTATALTPLWS
jgi:hypothetical protein